MKDFETFFVDEFPRLLERTSVPGMGEASWDRRAAWLLWRAMHPQPAPTVEMEPISRDGATVFQVASIIAERDSKSVFD